MVPPLVAAGVNLSFWPLGPIFRRAGAYFLRRTFDGDPLYTAVFRRYVQQLIKDGITQEFFIEGTRSRTGRTLQPRLGMLGMVLEAYARGVRRDVYLVPLGVSYERLVEERSMTDERRGARKTRENLLALLRARGVLKRRYGAVAIRFGTPMSLSELIGGERATLAAPSREPAAKAARGAVTERVALEVCRRISALVSAGRSAAGAAALLATPARSASACAPSSLCSSASRSRSPRACVTTSSAATSRRRSSCSRATVWFAARAIAARS
jgi:glycerol-3-phosphate O-acyltransferase